MKAFPVVVALTAIVGLVDAAGAQGAARKRLFFEGDLVRGAQQGAPGPFCVLSNQFKRLEKVVWRIRVLDAAGQSLDGKGSRAWSSNCPTARSSTRSSARIRRPRRVRPPTISGRRCGPSRRAIRAARSPTRSSRHGPRRPSRRPGSRSSRRPSQLQVVAGEIEIKKP